MRNQTNFNQTIHFINYSNQIESDTLASFLRKYWADETTTPKGVAPRLFVEEVVVADVTLEGNVIRYRSESAAMDAIEDEEGATYVTTDAYIVSTWGAAGNNYRKGNDLYDTYEEAYNVILESWHYDMMNESSNIPVARTLEECQEICRIH